MLSLAAWIFFLCSSQALKKSTSAPHRLSKSTPDSNGVDVDALKAQAADAAAKRLGLGDETGRLFETDDGPEEAERMLEIYKATEADRTAISLSINKKKFIADVDHSAISYISIQKNLYIVPPQLRQSTKQRPTELTVDKVRIPPPSRAPFVSFNSLAKIIRPKVQLMRSKLNIKIRGGGVIPAPVSSFAEAGVSGRLLEILTNKMGIKEPFPVQSQVRGAAPGDFFPAKT